MSQTVKFQKLRECKDRFHHRADFCEFLRESIDACIKESDATIESLNKLIGQMKMKHAKEITNLKEEHRKLLESIN